MHPLAQPRGNPGFPDDPSAQRRRGIAPKNIATFNIHTEALEPMAVGTSPVTMPRPTRAGGGNKRRSWAGSKPAKARRHRAVKPKAQCPKAMPVAVQFLLARGQRLRSSPAS